MDIKRSLSVSLFKALGYEDAGTWSPSTMRERLEGIHKTIAPDFTIGERDMDNLLDEVIFAGTTGEKFNISDDLKEVAPPPIKEEQETEPEPKPEKPFKRKYRQKPPFRVRPKEGRHFYAGILFKLHGIQNGITDEILEEISNKYSIRPNESTELQALKNSWHTLNGYIHGMNGLNLDKGKKKKTKRRTANGKG